MAENCGKCGAEVSPGYDFCLTCGIKFSEVSPKQTSTSRGSIIIRIIAFFICISIIGAIAFIIMISALLDNI